MRVVFAATGWADYTHWVTTDRAMVKRINRLIDAISRDPFQGIGKPEPLRHAFAGAWARRITDEHRLVYTIKNDDIVIVQARYHYDL